MANIQKILWSDKHKRYNNIALLFLIIGLSISFLSLQLSDYSNVIFDQKANADFILVGKKTSFLSSLNGSRNNISKEEIEALNQIECVEEAIGFNSNQFEIKANTEGQFRLSLDIFFESIPDHLLDHVPAAFKWQESQKFIPILVSKEILNIWNFGFSQSQGLPQLDVATVTSIPFKVTIGKDSYESRIVGITNRYPTVLVPHNFLSYANQKYASGRNVMNRAVIKTANSTDPTLQVFIKEHQLDFNQDQILKDKINSALSIMLRIFSGIGMGFLVLSMCILLLQLMLNIEQSKNNIQMLNTIGYSKLVISKSYMKRIYKMMAISVISTLAIGISISYFAIQILQQYLIEIEQILYIKNILVIIAIPAILVLIISRKIKTSLNNF